MRLKLNCLFVSIFCSSILFGQVSFENTDFQKMDKHAQKVPNHISENVQLLTEYLIKPATNDYEKIRGIYTWIISNIQYDKAAYNADFYRINKTNKDILKRRKAICFGYAKLLEEMCIYANIESHLIIGYAKETHSFSENYDEINHAWNAVKLDKKWFLIDATWAAGSRLSNNSFSQLSENSYFLSNPKNFVKNHLPAYRIWQLLDCPIDLETFKKTSFSIHKIEEKCIHFQDSISVFQQLSWLEQRIKTMESAYTENPVSKNKKELGQTYMDLEGRLSDYVERLQQNGLEDSIFIIQTQMIKLCEKASRLTNLYNNQVENCAYTFMNQGVAISRKNDIKKIDLELMLLYFKNTQQYLETLPSTIFIEQGIKQAKNYIEFTASELENY